MDGKTAQLHGAGPKIDHFVSSQNAENATFTRDMAAGMTGH